MSKIAAILLLGGEGLRMEQHFSEKKCPKQFLPLGKKKVYEWALETFEKSGLFSEIILVSLGGHPLKNCILGGKTRQESSFNGIKACQSDTDFVLIHDAVRPFVSLEILQRHAEALKTYSAVNTCIPTYDTINLVENKTVLSIPKRSLCMRGQTPQSFSYSLIKEAHGKTLQTNAPDDCSLLLELGYPVHVVQGSEENFKITTKHDYDFALFQINQKI
jgi:2-C-methyl-D-erythritol 4-phosphate cytidylyltransferase